jgi:hypothetical protein
LLGIAFALPSLTRAGEPASQPLPENPENYQTLLEQVNSIQQLRDVSPFDWSYEALRNLVENYGCIVGYPDRTYRGQRALTRDEFAAGLNSCLQQLERRLLEAQRTAPGFTQGPTPTPEAPGEPLPSAINRAFYNDTGRFYDIWNISGQANQIFGWRDFPGSFFDNQIANDGLTVNTIFEDALKQQQAGPRIVTRDIANPFDTSLRDNPSYTRTEAAPISNPSFPPGQGSFSP